MPGFERLLDQLPAPKSPLAKEKDLRAMAIAADKLTSGKTIAELAAEYRISKASIRDSLTRADQAGFYDAYRGVILEKLMPKALATYEAHLDRGSLEAARDILAILSKAPQGAQDVDVTTIEAYRALRIVRQELAAPRTADAVPEAPSDIDAGLPL
jgi:DNA-binding Lrp family transcriptional regulator